MRPENRNPRNLQTGALVTWGEPEPHPRDAPGPYP